MKLPEQIIKKPLLTEKGTQLEEDCNKVLFEVDLKANKLEIRRAVEKMYGVSVLRVATQVMRGKFKRVGRSVGQRPKWKKAIVTLIKGASIDFFAPE